VQESIFYCVREGAFNVEEKDRGHSSVPPGLLDPVREELHGIRGAKPGSTAEVASREQFVLLGKRGDVLSYQCCENLRNSIKERNGAV
jgi:hypothetical protein